MRSNHSRNLFGEHFQTASVVSAPETPNSDSQLHCDSLPWKVLEFTEVVTVIRQRWLIAFRTTRRLIRPCPKNEMIFVTIYGFQQQVVPAWQRGLRMAGQKIHSRARIEHLLRSVLWIILALLYCTKSAEEPISRERRGSEIPAQNRIFNKIQFPVHTPSL